MADFFLTHPKHVIDKPWLITLGGTNGAGKDEVGKILARLASYYFISVTDILRAEATRRREPIEREVLRTISAEWRREYGLGVLVDRGIEAYRQVENQYPGLVLASMRNPGEADRTHEDKGIVAWIDADPQLRFQRIQANAAARNRSEEDNVSYQQFLQDEAAEMHRSGDDATLDMAGVKERADIVIMNNATAIDQLEVIVMRAFGFTK